MTATDRGISISPPDSLLSYQSIQQLLTTYQGIMEARDDAVATAKQAQDKQTNYTKESLGVLDGQTTTAICADSRGDLSITCQSAGAATGGA